MSYEFPDILKPINLMQSNEHSKGLYYVLRKIKEGKKPMEIYGSLTTEKWDFEEFDQTIEKLRNPDFAKSQT